MDENERRMLMIVLSAIGGSRASIWSRPWKTMPAKEILFAFVIGFLFAIFVVPFAVSDIMNVDMKPLSVACGTTFIGAFAGVPLMPAIQRKVARIFGLTEGGEA